MVAFLDDYTAGFETTALQKMTLIGNQKVPDSRDYGVSRLYKKVRLKS
jgi:hypothetical protein